MTKRFQSYQPLIQLVTLQDENRKKIEGVVHTTSIEEGSFLFDLRTYYRADRSDIDSLVYDTITEEKLSTYPIRAILFPVRGPNIVQVGISLENTEIDLRRLMVIMILAG